MRLLPLLVAGVLLAAASACDSDPDGPSPTASSTSAAATTTTEAAPSASGTVPAPGRPLLTPTPTPAPRNPPLSSCTGRCPGSGSTAVPTPRPALDEFGVPKVPPLTSIGFSSGETLLQSDLELRGYGNAGRGPLNVARVVIPSINVDAPVETAFVGANGRMPEPSAASVVAWYDFSSFQGVGGLPLLGGNAPFAGDLDRSGVGPAVFFRLAELPAGGIITLVLNDGRHLYYRVEFNKTIAVDGMDWYGIVAATRDESATFITAAPPFDAGRYRMRRIVWARRVNCDVSSGAPVCEAPV